MAAKALSYLYCTVTQGAADAFVQASIATPFASADADVGLIRELLIEWPTTVTNAAAVSWELCLTRKTQAAMPNISDKSVILKKKKLANMSTSGIYQDPKAVEREVFEERDNLLIVEGTLYAQLDTNATGAANVVQLRIGYEFVKIKDVDRLQLIANSLQA